MMRIGADQLETKQENEYAGASIDA